eukprot:6313567-Heterocapsa_arctica.AAC.1
MAPLRSIAAAHNFLRSQLSPARSLTCSSMEVRAALPSSIPGRSEPLSEGAVRLALLIRSVSSSIVSGVVSEVAAPS